MVSTAFWKWEGASALSTSLTVLANLVLSPVATTNACISPCLATEPE